MVSLSLSLHLWLGKFTISVNRFFFLFLISVFKLIPSSNAFILHIGSKLAELSLRHSFCSALFLLVFAVAIFYVMTFLSRSWLIIKNVDSSLIMSSNVVQLLCVCCCCNVQSDSAILSYECVCVFVFMRARLWSQLAK